MSPPPPHTCTARRRWFLAVATTAATQFMKQKHFSVIRYSDDVSAKGVRLVCFGLRQSGIKPNKTNGGNICHGTYDRPLSPREVSASQVTGSLARLVARSRVGPGFPRSQDRSAGSAR